MKYRISERWSNGRPFVLLGITEKDRTQFFLTFDSFDEAYCVMLHYVWWSKTGFTVNESFYQFPDEQFEAGV